MPSLCLGAFSVLLGISSATPVSRQSVFSRQRRKICTSLWPIFSKRCSGPRRFKRSGFTDPAQNRTNPHVGLLLTGNRCQIISRATTQSLAFIASQPAHGECVSTIIRCARLRSSWSNVHAACQTILTVKLTLPTGPNEIGMTQKTVTSCA